MTKEFKEEVKKLGHKVHHYSDVYGQIRSDVYGQIRTGEVGTCRICKAELWKDLITDLGAYGTCTVVSGKITSGLLSCQEVQIKDIIE